MKEGQPVEGSGGGDAGDDWAEKKELLVGRSCFMACSVVVLFV